MRKIWLAPTGIKIKADGDEICNTFLAIEDITPPKVDENRYYWVELSEYQHVYNLLLDARTEIGKLRKAKKRRKQK